MASRYLITGVQLGMIMAMIGDEPKLTKKTVQEIIDKQWIFNSNAEIEEDVLRLNKFLEGEDGKEI